MEEYKRVELVDFEDDDFLDVEPVVPRPNGPLADFRWKVGCFINNHHIQTFLMTCILLNCVTFGLTATDIGNGEDRFATDFIDWVDNFFLGIFTAEIAFQLTYYGLSVRNQAWICFDAFIVLSSWITENMSIFKALKFRAFRILRALRLFHIGAIHDLLVALATVAPQLGIIFCLTVLMLYIFGVLFTQLFKPHRCGIDRFDRLDVSIFTLIQMMTLDFGDQMRLCMEDVTWAWIPFVGFIVVLGFGMFNLVVAVVCEAMVEMNPNESEKQKRFRVEQQLKYKLAHASRGLSNAIEQQALIEQRLQILSRYYLNEDFFQIEENFFHDILRKIPDLQNEESIHFENDDWHGEWATTSRKPGGLYSMERYQIGLIINSVSVRKFILVCIIINSICMGISASVPEEGNTSYALDHLDRIFLIIFSIESGMQLFYQGFYIYRDKWSCFDLFIILLSWALQSISVVRGFRVIRAVRITLRVGPMKVLLNAFLTSLAALSAITLLSLLVMYIFAVLFTQLYKDLEVGGESGLSHGYYTRLDYSLFTLLQIMTLDFSDPMREIMKEKPNAWFPHILFVTIMGLIFFNMMAGVVCDALQNDNEEDRKEPERISKLSFRLRCISFQVTLLANTKHTIHEQILVFQKLYDQEMAKRKKKGKKKAARRKKNKPLPDDESTPSTVPSHS